MREIKFRAFITIGDNKEINAMIDCISLYDSQNSGTHVDDFASQVKEQTGYQYDSINNIFIKEDIEIEADAFNVYSEDGDWVIFEGIVMQQTQYKDRDGIPIFEGDIYEWDYEYDADYDGDMPIIKRSQGCKVVESIFEDHWNIREAVKEGKGVKIIGNIYQNPDLLQ